MYVIDLGSDPSLREGRNLFRRRSSRSHVIEQGDSISSATHKISREKRKKAFEKMRGMSKSTSLCWNLTSFSSHFFLFYDDHTKLRKILRAVGKR